MTHALDIAARLAVEGRWNCRIGRVRFKRRTRYRSPAAFNLKTNELRQAIARGRG
jgi:hypothetical protein